MSYIGDMSEFGYLKYVVSGSAEEGYVQKLRDDAPDWAREQFEIEKNRKRQEYEDITSGKLKVE